MRCCLALSLTVSLLGLAPLARAAETTAAASFPTAQAAFEAGTAALRSMDLVKAREALEQGLKLSPDPTLKGRIYRTLRTPYRALPDVDLYVTAEEYIIRNPQSPAERSVSRGALVSHVTARARAREVAERFETQLKSDPDDRTALYVLSGFYAGSLKQPQRAVELTERLLALNKKQGETPDLELSVQLAQQYLKVDRPKDAAELYEKLAALDPGQSPWCLKDAAAAWLKANDKPHALAAAKTAAAGAPDTRSGLLTHFWHRGLGEVFLAVGEPALAVPQLQKAVDTATIEGYKQDCARLLEEARKLSAAG